MNASNLNLFGLCQLGNWLLVKAQVAPVGRPAPDGGITNA